ncbi:hypothetical protein LCGC14_1383830 [marine sediment metagenome]|uniref:KOW domain-containing protein n=1 Tax=marine sediment metagenome TaxID=412755 RepID=A0A0F9K238_9ZZZZ
MTDNEKMTKILGDIMTIIDHKCLQTIQSAARNRRNEVAQVETATWRIDDEVQLLPEHQYRKPHGAIGKVQKINKVKIVVDFGNGMIYTVPKTMLTRIS